MLIRTRSLVSIALFIVLLAVGPPATLSFLRASQLQEPDRIQEEESRPEPDAPPRGWQDFPQDDEGFHLLLHKVNLKAEKPLWKIANEHFFKDGGSVELNNGILTLPIGTPGTGVVAAFDVPTMDYELAFEVRRTAGTDFFCGMTFPFEKQHATLILGGWGGKTAGISNINRFSAIENSTSTTVHFENDRWYKIRFRVTEDQIECFLDGKSLFWLDPLDKKLETWWEQRPMEPLGFASWKSTGQIRNLRIKAIQPASESSSR